MKKCLLSFDMFGSNPKIYYRGKESYRTIIGFLLTILSMILILGFIIYFFIRYIKGEEIYIKSSYENNITNFSVGLSNKEIRYKLVDSNNKEVNQTILTVFPFYTQEGNSPVNQMLNTSKCDISDMLLRKDIIDETDYSKNYSCLSKDNNNYLEIKSNLTHNSYVDFYVAKCLNSTKNNRHCLSLEDIDIYLIRNKIYLLIYFEDNAIKHSNSYPYKSTYVMKKIEIDSSLYYKYYFTYQKVLYKSDHGIIFSKNKEYNSYTLENNNLLKVNLPTYSPLFPNSLMEFRVSINPNSAKYYERTYSKFQNFLADAGGFTILIIKICEFIVFLFSHGIMFTDILSVKEKKQRESQVSSHHIQELSNGNLNQSSSLDPISKVELNTKQGLTISNKNLGVITYQNSAFKNNDGLIQKNLRAKKKKEKEKNINIWDSFCYSIICRRITSKRSWYIKYCELIVKSRLSSNEMIIKLSEIEKLTSNFNSLNNSSNSSNYAIQNVFSKGSNKINTSLIKENTNSIIENESNGENSKKEEDRKENFVV